MNENPSISSLKNNGKSILIDWSDGEQSKFNFLWLRDNCPSEVHPTARERTFNLLNVSENIHPKAFTINDNCLLYTSPSPRDGLLSRMPSSA